MLGGRRREHRPRGVGGVGARVLAAAARLGVRALDGGASLGAVEAEEGVRASVEQLAGPSHGRVEILSARADLDRVFIAVDSKATLLANAEAEAARKAGRRVDLNANEKKALKRTEFFTALIHIATIKFVRTGKLSSVAKALQKLMVECVDPLINYDLLPDPNLFRRSCYVKSVSAELAKHSTSLHHLHAALSELEFGAYAKRMGNRSWLACLRALGLIGIDLSERDCSLCFVWSRMATSGAPSPNDDRLPFEGFLEALCRLSTIKALPLDHEVRAKGCDDAGQYVHLMNSSEDTKREWVLMQKKRKIGWGGMPAQPLERCVSHVLWIVVRSIEKIVMEGRDSDESNGELSKTEIATWLVRQLGSHK